MLESIFIRPHTVDRIRALWLGPPIERYVRIGETLLATYGFDLAPYHPLIMGATS